ncbi:hypothetical protein SUGI_0891480 [Cryptomeria japonica]|uniref:uncharacterized protein LOC131045282 n=1 Tax=Cryptomeria japonica TaxID=3369 RepID=UPI0024149C33|nr:uncharacterized protein LOC131045282 [Cryptomeria japonica]XP_057834824.1 uncharacterized protein LOC131045282 [Cryptomeria japonica]XP_057834825.1 uncharacterized protein LOC131045282 [Cryptomeria japonica]GLJ42963.1 hypothetical protein SUGI_0891480 [Cryptomeria japonica]
MGRGRGRRRHGNGSGSGKGEDMVEEFGEPSGGRHRGASHHRLRNNRHGIGGFRRGGYSGQSLFVEGGALAEWQPLGNSRESGRRSMQCRVDSQRPSASTSGRGRRQGLKDSHNRPHILHKNNNAISYSYPDVEITVGSPSISYRYSDVEAATDSPSFGLGYDGNSSTPHASKNQSLGTIDSAAEVKVTAISTTCNTICPVTVLPSSETQVAVFLDKNPSKGLTSESATYHRSTDIELNEETRPGLGYPLETAILSPAEDYLEAIDSAPEVEVSTISTPCNKICPAIVIPSSETQVAVFLDKNPGKGLTSESAIYHRSTDIVLNEETRPGLGYHLERAIPPPAEEYLELPDEECKGGQTNKALETSNRKKKKKGRYWKQGKWKKETSTDKNKNEGFLVIGGARIYTTDVSVREEVDSVMLDQYEEGSSKSCGQLSSEIVGEPRAMSGEISSTSNSDVLSESSEYYESGSDIDDETALDYLEGLGGSYSELLKAEWLLDRGALEQISHGEMSESTDEESIDSESSDEADDGQNAFENLTEKCSSGKGSFRKSIANEVCDIKMEKLRQSILFDEQDSDGSEAEFQTHFGNRSFRKEDADGQEAINHQDSIEKSLAGIVISKDFRTPSNKKKNKSVHTPHTWSVDKKNIKDKGVPGAKKKHHKETIAAKRRERSLRRGVDLESINHSLEKMVLDSVDMVAFQPMHSRDCSQVQRLASIYRLKSGRQGSGKKRIVTVTRTKHTCMPSASDKSRLLKLLGDGWESDEVSYRSSFNKAKPSSEKNRMDAKGRRAARKAYCSMKHDESFFREFKSTPSKIVYVHSGNTAVSGNKKVGTLKKSERRRVTDYANQPMSFVSSGTMEPDAGIAETSVSCVNIAEINVKAHQNGLSLERKVSVSSSKMGSFEVHTKGFGSRMMVKMGFVEGTGLGKDGQGIVQPIEAIKRPKSLGLGL